MKKIAILLGILLITSILSPVLGATIDPDKIHFYMYGMKTCPHCQRMKEEIPKAYGEDSLTYYELVGNEENRGLFQEQYQYTGISGVPAIAITYNGTLYAILEGEFNVSAVPQLIEEAMKSNGVLLFNGKWYIFPRNDTESLKAINALYAIFVEHRMPESPTTTSSTSTTSTSTTTSTTTSTHTTSTSHTETSSTSSGGGGGICGPALIVLLAALPLLRKKLR